MLRFGTPPVHASASTAKREGGSAYTRTSLAALLGVAALLAAAPARAQEVVKIGIPIGLSGANSVVAPSVVQAAQLAVAEINGKGGILGKKVELAVADDGSGADGAVKAFNSLVFQ